LATLRMNFLCVDRINRLSKPVLKGSADLLQAIYRKHEWADVSGYQKGGYLAEWKWELGERFHEHQDYCSWIGT
jgi:hypothetical protein